MNSPLVSCVIPCYNRSTMVRDAIDSALAQTYKNLEIIAVDDGSTDDTPKVLELYGDRIQVVSQPNGGTGAARNHGASVASGQYLAWLDSDDEWLPQKIAAQVSAAERCAEADVFYTRCRPIDADGKPPAPTEEITVPLETIRDDILRMMVVESEVMPSSCLLRRAVFDRVGGYDAAYRFSEDWELDFRLAQKAKFAYIDAPLTRYRIHDESKTKDRWPHAVGRLKLRQAIESARIELIGHDSTGALSEAYRRHTVKFADAYYRVGSISLVNGDLVQADRALREAVRLNPRVFKYYTRLIGTAVKTAISEKHRPA